jgi:hypothetical protein
MLRNSIALRTMSGCGSGAGSPRDSASRATCAAARSTAREHSSRHRRTSPDADDTWCVGVTG